MNDFKNFKAKLDEKKGLWDNIHAKRKRGEKPNPPGHPDRPTAQDFKDAQKTSKKESVEEKKLTPAEIKGDNKETEVSEVSMDTAKSAYYRRKSQAQGAAHQGSMDYAKKQMAKARKTKSYIDKRESVEEKKLTPAEMKKREEIAKAMERDNPGMDMGKKMAIATATAKKVAEEVELDITEISLDMLTKKISNSGMTTTKKANKMDKTKNDLAAMKARLSGKPALAKEAYEDDEPASPDEASMAMRQLGFIEYAAEEVMDHIKAGKEFPEWMQNKLSKLHGQMESLHSALGDHGEDEEDMKEAVRRKGAPKMTGDSFAMQRAKDAELNKALDRTKTGRKKPVRQMTSTQRSLAQLRREETELDEGISNNMRLISKIKNSGVVKSGSMSKDTKPAPKKEGVNTADRKPEKFIKPDGKIGIRMVPMDKNIVDKNK